VALSITGLLMEGSLYVSVVARGSLSIQVKEEDRGSSGKVVWAVYIGQCISK